MDEQQLQLVVAQALDRYLAALDQAGAPYATNPALWQQMSIPVSQAAVSVYYDQGAPQSQPQAIDPGATLATQVQQSQLVTQAPATIDQHMALAFTAGGVVAAAALLAGSGIAWKTLTSIIGTNVYLWAAAAGATDAALSLRMRTKTWVAKDDAKTRPSHLLADGETVSIGSAFNVGGFMLRYPHDPFGPPQETVNCRCKVRYGR
jgi:hypothetical protein